MNAPPSDVLTDTAPTRIVLRPHRQPRVSKLARGIGLDEHDDFLISRRVANALNAGAYAVLAVSVFEATAWFLTWQALLAGGVFSFGPMSIAAALLAVMTAGVVALVDRAIITSQSAPKVGGALGALKRSLKTLKSLTPRLIIVFAAIYFTGPALHETVFEEVIDQRLHEEAIIAEGVRRVTGLIEAREARDAAADANPTDIAETTAEAERVKEAEGDVAALAAQLDAAVAEEARCASVLRSAENAVAQARKDAKAADDLADRARRRAARVWRKVRGLPADTDSATRAKREAGARVYDRRARAAAAAARQADRKVRRREELRDTAGNEHATAAAKTVAAREALGRVDGQLDDARDALHGVEEAIQEKLDGKVDVADQEIKRLRTWLERLQRATPDESVSERDDGTGFSFRPAVAGPIERARILHDLREGNPALTLAEPRIMSVLEREVPFVLPADDPASVLRRRQEASFIEARYWYVYAILAFIPMLAIMVKFVYAGALSSYFDRERQVAAGNPAAVADQRAEEEARRVAEERAAERRLAARRATTRREPRPEVAQKQPSSDPSEVGTPRGDSWTAGLAARRDEGDEG